MRNIHSIFISVILLVGCYFFITPTYILAQQEQIPSNIRYKKASAVVNQKAKAFLERIFSSDNNNDKVETYFVNAVTCAPNLWVEITTQPESKSLTGKLIIGLIPTNINGETQLVKQEGRAFSATDEKKTLWAIINQRYIGDNIVVRKANIDEIKYFWSTIPFDIEEPLFIIELKKSKLLVNMQLEKGEPKIFWLDLIKDKNSPVTLEWKEFTSVEGNFSISMPGEPAASKDSPDSLINNVFQMKDPLLNEYYVSFKDFPGKQIKSEDLFNSLREVYINNFKGNLLKELSINMNEYPGKLFVMEMPNGNVLQAKIFLIEHRMYQALVLTSARSSDILFKMVKVFNSVIIANS